MKGICFKKSLLLKTVAGTKIQTRRIDAGNNTPRYKVGDKLYLKEPYIPDPDGNGYRYKYDAGRFIEEYKYDWKNKLFMPEEAARYYIEITGVTSQNLQDITEEECYKEGIVVFTPPDKAPLYMAEVDNYLIAEPSAREAYAELIDRINGKGTWESNPLVWVYDYKLTTK